jgi:hypothetical protein
MLPPPVAEEIQLGYEITLLRDGQSDSELQRLKLTQEHPAAAFVE